MGQYISTEEFEKTYLVTERSSYRCPYVKDLNLTEWDFVDCKSEDYYFSDKRFTKIPLKFYVLEI